MNFKFGVRAHDMAPKTDIDSLLDIVQGLGIPYIQLVFPKALSDSSLSEENVERVSSSLKKHGIQVSLLGAYFNPVHSDPETVKKGIFNFEENLRISSRLPCPYVGSETGSFNNSPWTFVPKNHTEEGYQQSKAVFAELTKAAEKYDSQLLIEPAWGHVMYSPSVLKRLVSELNSPRVHVTIDLYNLLYEGNFEKRNEIFYEALSAFGQEVKVIHLKDAFLDNSGILMQICPGKGKFDYPFMLKTIAEFCPEAVLTFEGVSRQDIAFSYGYLKGLEESI